MTTRLMHASIPFLLSGTLFSGAPLLLQRPELPRAHANVQDSRPGFNPLVMLTEFDPWAMVVGSDSPAFVLYENGTVIYRKEGLKSGEYVSTVLTEHDSTELIRSLSPENLEKLGPHYSISEWITDQPTTVLTLRTGRGTLKKISVYGNIRSLQEKSGEQLPLPQELMSAIRNLITFDARNALPWRPDYIEAMVWPFEYAKGAPAEWPKNWPDLKDKKTLRHGNLYSIFLDGAELEGLKLFLRSVKPKQAVLINGKKWAISARFPFPHEYPPL